jgi:uncharacterized membrane protein
LADCRHNSPEALLLTEPFLLAKPEESQRVQRAHTLPSKVTALEIEPRSRQGLLPLLALVAATGLSLATLALRTYRTGDAYYTFLGWNLCLAWIPFVCALAAFYRFRRSHDVLVLALLLLWLLFFPNAPYMLTDFIHLGEQSSAPLWYDALMLSSFAWTALLLGFASTYLVQLVLRSLLGRRWSWGVVAVAFALGSFGVYLGRFVRFNSWDVLVRPARIAHVIGDQIENPFHQPRMVATLLILAIFLLVGYALFYGLAEMRLELHAKAGSRPAAREERARRGAMPS